MKLTDILTEQVMRGHLANANIATIESEKERIITTFLARQYSSISSVYTLNWILEPDIEVFNFLVNGALIVVLELDKAENTCNIIRELSIGEYKIGLKKKDQLKLLVALDLAIKNRK